MKRIVFPLFLILTGLTIFFSSWSVLHGDIHWISDIARDTFLLEEIGVKKLILIGPRASGGLFHGPLWAYMNYPGFIIGNGNPVALGWYWIFLIIVFLIVCFWIAKKMFGRNTAMLFVLMTSLYLAFHANELTNPHGAMFFIPLFFYFFVRYVETGRLRFLLYHLMAAGGIIQTQIAIGVPFLVLTLILVTVIALKRKNPAHLLAFLLVPVILGNFLLFDVRHEFILTKNVFRHMGTTDANATFVSLLTDRVSYIMTRIEFLRFGPPNGQLYVVIVFIFFCIVQIKQKIHRNVYLVFIYYYLGFFVLSLFNRFNLLSFYVFPLLPLVFLIFSSFITSLYSRLFLAIFGIMYALNVVGFYLYIQQENAAIGNGQYSWKAVFTAAQSAYQGDEKEFGYFIYSPDILGYGPRYAMEYARKINNKNGYAFEKKPITYLLIEPPARDNPFTSEEKWKLYQIHIYSEPVAVKTFESGYKVEKHLLNNEKLTIGYDPGINPGLHYR